MKNKLLILFVSFFCFSCSHKTTESNAGIPGVTKSEIGEKVESIEKKYGKPNETNVEKFGLENFRVIEYLDNEGHPNTFYTIDRDGKVIGKSIWVNPKQKMADFKWLLQNQFPSSQFETYIPCETNGNQKFSVDQNQGIFIAHQEEKVLLIS
ncbi:MAG: hypothetical protein ACK5P5_02390 [Pseudobdellovibrionaceae bacterium]